MTNEQLVVLLSMFRARLSAAIIATEDQLIKEAPTLERERLHNHTGPNHTVFEVLLQPCTDPNHWTESAGRILALDELREVIGELDNYIVVLQTGETVDAYRCSHSPSARTVPSTFNAPARHSSTTSSARTCAAVRSSTRTPTADAASVRTRLRIVVLSRSVRKYSTFGT